MKIIFSWSAFGAADDSTLMPQCATVEVSNGYISSLLVDDEGHGLEFLVKWVAKGVENIYKIQNGELDYYDWRGNAWAAEISKENVKIYWDYDDTDCSDNMSFDDFSKVVFAWNEFIRSKPNLDYNLSIEV